MEWLCGLFMLAGAAFFIVAGLRLFFRKTAPPAPAGPRTACPFCGFVAAETTCSNCTRLKTSPVGERLNEIAAALRTVERMTRDGSLDAVTFQRLVTLLDREAAETRNPRLAAERRAREAAAARPVPPVTPTPPTQSEAIKPISEAVAEDPVLLEPDDAPEPSAPLEPAAGLTRAPRQAAPPPVAPRKPLVELIGAFLEESHIRWGELVGGMLIVLCSAALVVSFWSRIAELPALQFFLFTAVTAAVYGLGFYSEHRWRLPMTSRGSLIIATLLVPLNFLAIAAFSESYSVWDWRVLTGEVTAIALFGVLLWKAGDVLVPRWSPLLTLGVLGPSIAQLVIRRVLEPGVESSLTSRLIMALLPLGCYLGAGAIVHARAWSWRSIPAARAHRVFAIIGLTTFAAVVALGLLIHRCWPSVHGLRSLAPILVLHGLPALGVGLLFWRKRMSRRFAGLQTVGIAIGVGGAAVMAMCTLIAFPEPMWLVPTLAIDAAVLVAIALAFRMSAAHVPVAACLTAIHFLLVHVLRGRLPWRGVEAMDLVKAVASPSNGLAFTLLGAAFAAVAAAFLSLKRRTDGLIYGASGVLLALLGLLYVTVHGFGRADDHGATWIYLVEALIAFAVAWRWRRPEATWAGCVLLLAALVQGIAFRFEAVLALDYPITTALLAFATLTVAAAVGLRRTRGETLVALWRPLGMASLAITGVSFVVVLSTFLAAGRDPGWAFAGRMLWVAALLLTLALWYRAAAIFAAMQAATSAAVVFGVLAWLPSLAWYRADKLPWLHPWTVESVGVALAALGLVWIALRLAIRRAGTEWVQKLVVPFEPTFDRFVTGGLMVVLASLAIGAGWPAVAREMSSRVIASAGVSEAAGWGAWLLLGAVAAVIAASLWEAFPKRRVLALVGLGFVACVLFAARFEPVAAGASALRWAIAGYLLLVSAAVWGRAGLARAVAPMRWPDFDVNAPSLGRAAGLMVSLVAAAVIVVLSVYPAGAAIDRHPIVGPAAGTFFATLGSLGSYLPPLAVLAAALARHAYREREPWYALSAAFVVHVGVTVAHLTVVTADGFTQGEEWLDLLASNAIAAGLIAALWIAARTRFARFRELAEEPTAAFHHLFVLASLGLLVVMASGGLMFDALRDPLATNVWLAGAAAVAAAIALTACRFDAAARRYVPAGAYVLGLTALGLALDRFDLRPLWLAWSGAVLLPVYAAASVPIAEKRKLDEAERAWLTPATSVLSVVGVLLSLVSVWAIQANDTGAASLAWAARAAAAVLPVGFAFALGRLADAPDRPRLRHAALMLGALVSVLFGWSWFEPGGANDTLLHRAVTVMVALASCAAAYGFQIKRLGSSAWADALARVTPAVGGVAFATLQLVLVAEVIDWLDDGTIAIAPWAIAAVALAMAGSAAAAVVFAVAPGRDPLSLSERGRTAYVYGAEILLALLFLHIRLTMPWLFSGFWSRFWPLIVMVISFAGIGLSELFRRRQQRVLEEPLRITGMLLPVLPVITFYNTADTHRVHLSVLMLLVGVLYGVLSSMRKSFTMGVLAALSLSGALWYLLHHTQHLGFWEHPQLWVIPAALAVLAAAQLNRERLAAPQLATIRYLCVTVIYVSSTAEIFLSGVASSPWLPLVLMGLSVAGVALGVAVRVRSFLFLGATFLLISLITMVWHASENLGWTWLWFVAGIALGGAILVLLGIAERKRQAMVKLVEGLRAWEG